MRLPPAPLAPAAASGIASQKPSAERISAPRSKASTISLALLQTSAAARSEVPDCG
jgi:hypothetical protein